MWKLQILEGRYQLAQRTWGKTIILHYWQIIDILDHSLPILNLLGKDFSWQIRKAEWGRIEVLRSFHGRTDQKRYSAYCRQIFVRFQSIIFKHLGDIIPFRHANVPIWIWRLAISRHYWGLPKACWYVFQNIRTLRMNLRKRTIKNSDLGKILDNVQWNHELRLDECLSAEGVS